MRADIHDGQEHKRSIHGPDTEAQDQSSPSVTFGLQHTAGPYSWVTSDRAFGPPARPDIRYTSNSDRILQSSEMSRRAMQTPRTERKGIVPRIVVEGDFAGLVVHNNSHW
jgi:hypothetical protein